VVEGFVLIFGIDKNDDLFTNCGDGAHYL